MTARAKRVPRLWCALQGLLPMETRGVTLRVDAAAARKADATEAAGDKSRVRRATSWAAQGTS